MARKKQQRRRKKRGPKTPKEIRKPLETMSDRRHTLDCNWWLDECTCGRPPKEVVDEQVRELTEELRKVNEEKP